VFKRKEKNKAPRRLASFFRKSPRERRRSSLLFYFVLLLIMLFALNVALLLPQQLSSVFYEIEIWIISFLRSPLTLQVWVWMVISVLLVLGGYFLLPVLTIPETEEFFIVRDTWLEGEIRFFKTLTGKTIGVHREYVKSFGVWKFKHYFVIGFVGRVVFDDYILYQSRDLEVTKIILAERLAQQLAEENAVLREMLKRYEPTFTREDLKLILGRKEEET